MASWGSVALDLKYCARSMRRRPLLPAAAVAILAAGLGTAWAVEAMARGVTQSTVIFRDPGRLVIAVQPTSGVLVSPYNWEPHPQASSICEQTGEFHLESGFWGSGAGRRRLLLAYAMPQFFTTLGVHMAMGHA
ncbi:MAG: hypothetical protein ACRD1E_10855, partial [Terriglobales bacterium]